MESTEEWKIVSNSGRDRGKRPMYEENPTIVNCMNGFVVLGGMKAPLMDNDDPWLGHGMLGSLIKLGSLWRSSPVS